MTGRIPLKPFHCSAIAATASEGERRSSDLFC
jgi:hypothetical protein